jgi:CBS domain containing-hemolysin-like protein
MNHSWEFFLSLLVICLVVQAFFAMLEMACVSFNKVRLQYYVSKGNRRAIWLSNLLHHPGRLFGTTLICVNLALQLGSECSRRFYESVGLNPDFAPLTQVVIVLIFAEIAPLLAGRRYAEHAAMLGIPVLFLTSIVLAPLIWLFDIFCRALHRVIGSRQGAGLYLSREELQKILEEQEEQEFNTVVSNIFSLKTMTAKELMQPLSNIQLVPSICTVAEMRSLLTLHYSPFVPIYHKSPENIVAVAFPRDLLRQAENKRIREYARPPWFITETDSIMSILKQFRRNNQSVAVVLNEKGLAIGILTLDEIIDEIFGQADSWMQFEELTPGEKRVVIDRTFSGDTKIADFNAAYRAHLDPKGTDTLAELVTLTLGHPPAVGESVKIDDFEFVVEEASILGAKSISIRTI